jgi:putative DNA-invertase from lambdoid prophage Rac
MEIKRKRLGYARVSTAEQNTANQILEFKKLGITPKDIYEDTGISGTIPAKKRKGFRQVYEQILKGEVEELYIFELSRLGRTSSESIMLFIEIEQIGTMIKSLSPNEAWTKSSDDQAIRNVYTAMFSWFADIERRNISERTKVGISRAREEGKHIGRPYKEPDRKAYEKHKAAGLKIAQIARVMQVPATTLYRYAKQWENEERIKRNEGI